MQANKKRRVSLSAKLKVAKLPKETQKELLREYQRS